MAPNDPLHPSARADLQRQVIEKLQVARAALFYVVDLVEHEEMGGQKKAGFQPQLRVPNHDWVWGSDSVT